MEYDMFSIFGALGNAKDKARKHRYKCLYPGCTKVAVGCHLVQRHPILVSISEEGNLYQIFDNEINPLSGDYDDLKERHVSVLHALSLPLFCGKHDNDLFKPIEVGEVDLLSAKTFLLFSYRALAAQRFFESKRHVQYQNTGFDDELHNYQRDYSLHVIRRFDSTMNMLLQDIQCESFDSYEYTLVDLPYKPISGSDAVVDEDEMVFSYEGGNMEERPINTLYLTLLPMVDRKVLKLLIGYHKSFVGEAQKSFYDKLRDGNDSCTIFDIICRMKSWCCSPSLIQDRDFMTKYEIRRNEIIWMGGC